MNATYNSRREREALFERFRDVFARAASQRDQRQDFVTLATSRGRSELGWVLYERAVMREEVNRARAERGLPPVDRSVVERAEQHAAGHVDYATKWPLYCAEIVLDMPPWISPARSDTT